MRTADQGQAAVPRERVCRRRFPGRLGRGFLGREKISYGLSRMWSAIQDSPGARGNPGFAIRAPGSVYGIFYCLSAQSYENGQGTALYRRG